MFDDSLLSLFPLAEGNGPLSPRFFLEVHLISGLFSLMISSFSLSGTF